MPITVEQYFSLANVFRGWAPCTVFPHIFLRCGWLCLVSHRLAGSVGLPWGNPVLSSCQGMLEKSNGKTDCNLGEHPSSEWFFHCPWKQSSSMWDEHGWALGIFAGKGDKREGNIRILISRDTMGFLPVGIWVFPKSHSHLRKEGAHSSTQIINEMLLLNAEAKFFHLKFNTFLETTRRTALRNVP